VSNFRTVIVRVMAAALVAILMWSGRAEAQLGRESVLRSAEARLEGRLDPAAQRAVVAIIDSSIAAGLPLELGGRLVSRALQSSVHAIETERMLAEVRELADRLVSARRVLAPATFDEVDAAAEALDVGISAGTLRSLRAARPRGTLAVPLVVLVDLVVRGVPADTAAYLILAIAEKQATDMQYEALRLQVASDIGRGTLPVVAAATRTRGVLGAAASAAAAATLGADAIGTQDGGTTRSTRPPGGPPPPP